MLDKRYYINVGKGGTFLPSVSASAAIYDTTPNNIDSIFDYFGENPPEKIVLYFHGGLVNVNDGMESATDFTKGILQKTNTYPISFVWETGLIETLTQDFSTIRSSKLFKKLLEKIIKVAAKKMGIDFSLSAQVGIRGSESLTYEEINRELEEELPFEEYNFRGGSRSVTNNISDEELKEEIAAELEIEMEADEDLLKLFEEEKTLEESRALNMEKLSDSEEQRSRGIISSLLALKPLVKIVFRIVKRHIKNRDHGFYPTVIEELIREFYIADFGSLVWSSMKNKGTDMWANVNETGLKQRAGTYFISKLESFIEHHPETLVNLLGHSAGSIVICHLLLSLRERGSKIIFDKIIFLAPACRCELFEDAVLGNQDHYNFFRMFTMADSFEFKDRMIPYVYTRSLLYLVSGALEDHGDSFDAPILGLQRHNLAKRPYHNLSSIKAIQDYFSDDVKRVVYSVTPEDGPDGFRSESIKHGAFNDLGEVTMNSVLYLLQ